MASLDEEPSSDNLGTGLPASIHSVGKGSHEAIHTPV